MPNITINNSNGLIRQLKTDEELLAGKDLEPAERVRRLKAIMKAKCTLLTPAMIGIIEEIASSHNNSAKMRFEAAKYLVDRGLGTPDKEIADLPTSKTVEITDAEIDEVLSGSNVDDSD